MDLIRVKRGVSSFIILINGIFLDDRGLLYMHHTDFLFLFKSYHFHYPSCSNLSKVQFNSMFIFLVG